MNVNVYKWIMDVYVEIYVKLMGKKFVGSIFCKNVKYIKFLWGYVILKNFVKLWNLYIFKNNICIWYGGFCYIYRIL